MRSKQPIELFPGHGKRRTAFRWRLTRIPRIEEKDCQHSTRGLQGAEDSTDIIWTTSRFDRTKTGVLKNPGKPICQFNRQIKEIRQLVGFLADRRESAGMVDCTRGDIQTNHFCRRTDSCNGSNIVSRAATGHEHAAVQRAAAFEPFQKRRRSRSFFPGCITGPVSLFPIHASCQLTRLIDRLECQKKLDFKLPDRTSVQHPCSEKGLNQKSDPNHANTQARQPEHPASDQDRNRSDRNGYLEHGDAARQHLVGA
jgi:hypothetical protein